MNLLVWYRSLMRSVSAALVKLIATATSGLVSFTTNVIRQVKVTCEFSPVQEGTGDPSPDNVRPISGWTGANIYRQSENMLNSDPNTWTQGGRSASNGSLNASLTNRITQTYASRFAIVPNTTYYLSFDDGVQLAPYYYNNNSFVSSSTWLDSGATIIAPQNANKMCFVLRKTDNSDITVSVLDNLELYIGISPFNILPINWKSEAGTIYGGTVTLNEDGSADLLVDREAVDMGTLTFTGASNYGDGKFMCTLPQRYIATPSIPHLACEVYKQAGKASAFYNGDLSVWYYNNTSFNRLLLKDTNFYIDGTPDVSGLHDSIDGKLIVLDLRNPQTYHFPNVGKLNSFLGQNNIWHNMNGDITAEYWIKQ